MPVINKKKQVVFFGAFSVVPVTEFFKVISSHFSDTSFVPTVVNVIDMKVAPFPFQAVKLVDEQNQREILFQSSRIDYVDISDKSTIESALSDAFEMLAKFASGYKFSRIGVVEESTVIPVETSFLDNLLKQIGSSISPDAVEWKVRWVEYQELGGLQMVVAQDFTRSAGVLNMASSLEELVSLGALFDVSTDYKSIDLKYSFEELKTFGEIAAKEILVLKKNYGVDD